MPLDQPTSSTCVTYTYTLSFYNAMRASAVYAMALCPVTCLCPIKTVKHFSMQTVTTVVQGL